MYCVLLGTKMGSSVLPEVMASSRCSVKQCGQIVLRLLLSIQLMSTFNLITCTCMPLQ